MRGRAVVVLGVMVTVTVLLGAEQPGASVGTYTDTRYGFSIQAPAFPEAPSGGGVVPVQMFSPAELGFASNVNVMVQRAASSRPLYRQASRNQFQQMGLTINSDTDLTVSGKDAVLFNYEGAMGGRELRWLALAVIDAEQVFLVTCTAPKDTFGRYEKQFHACLDSFHLLEQLPGG